MRSKLRLRVVLPVAVLGLLGLGIGAFAFNGTPPNPSPPAGPPAGPPEPEEQGEQTESSNMTLEQWAARASRICDRYNRRQPNLASWTSSAEVVATVDGVVALGRQTVHRLRALETPDRGARRVERMVNIIDRAFDRLDEMGASAASANKSRLIALDFASSALIARAARLAERLGTVPCIEGESAAVRLARKLEQRRIVVVALFAPASTVDSLAVAEARAGAKAAGAAFLAVDTYQTRQIAGLAAKYALRGAPAVVVFRRGPRLTAHFVGYQDREVVAQAVQNARR